MSWAATLRQSPSTGVEPPLPERLGRYRIERCVGKGAMGVVYKAYDPKLERQVVIKTLRRDATRPPDIEQELVERFYREARAAGCLTHPAVVSVFDVERDGDSGVDFIAMEWVDGASLQELLSSGNPIPPAQVVRDLRPVAAALDEAHAHGIVHRDVKPSNILIRSDGVVKIADFGIAHLESSDLTVAGRVLGSPCYMAPEQIEGRHIDGGTDQFALAVVIYELLTGCRPFGGDRVSTVAYRIVHEAPLPVAALRPDLPLGVSDVLARGLSKSSPDRFPSCVALVDALQHALASAALDAPLQAPAAVIMPTPRATPQPPSLFVPFMLGLVSAAAMALLILVAAWRMSSSALTLPAVAAAPPPAPRSSSAPPAPAADLPLEPLPVPAAPAVGASTSGSDSDGQLTVRLEHHLKEGTIVIAVDGEPRYEGELHGVRKKIGPIPLWHRLVQTEQEFPLELTPGTHIVEVHVVAPDAHVDSTATRSVTLPAGSACALQAELSAFDHDLELASGCGA